MGQGGAVVADLNELPGWANTAISVVTGAGLAFLGLRKKFSQDSTSIAYDKAQAEHLATVTAERNTYREIAMRLQDQRSEDSALNARLEERVAASVAETLRLRDEILAMRMHTRKLTAIILKLDPNASNLLQLDSNGDGIPEFIDKHPEKE